MIGRKINVLYGGTSLSHIQLAGRGLAAPFLSHRQEKRHDIEVQKQQTDGNVKTFDRMMRKSSL